MSPDQWTPGRLNDRFASIDHRLEDLRKQVDTARHQTEAFAPMVVTIDHLQRDVAELKVDVKEIVNRSVTLRIIIVMAPVLLTCMGFAVALLTGKIG